MGPMSLVAGIDSSTQSCKVVIRDAETGKLVRQGRASHPDGTEVHPDAWWSALQQAIEEAGGLDDVAAASVAGQQHGMGVLAGGGGPRPAGAPQGQGCGGGGGGGGVGPPGLVGTDPGGAGAAADLIEEL